MHLSSSRDFFINMSCVCIVTEKLVEYPAAVIVTQDHKILSFPRAKSTSRQSYGPPTELVITNGMTSYSDILLNTVCRPWYKRFYLFLCLVDSTCYMSKK